MDCPSEKSVHSLSLSRSFVRQNTLGDIVGCFSNENKQREEFIEETAWTIAPD